MEIHLSVFIDQSRSEVFEFMKDMRNHPQEENSKVLRVDKITQGEIAAGAQFRELVRMLPVLNVSFFNQISRYEPDEKIEITWHGGGMEGVLRFQFELHEGGTLLKVQELISLRGVMKWVERMVEQNFRGMWEKRLHGIERVLMSMR